MLQRKPHADHDGKLSSVANRWQKPRSKHARSKILQLPSARPSVADDSSPWHIEAADGNATLRLSSGMVVGTDDDGLLAFNGETRAHGVICHCDKDRLYLTPVAGFAALDGVLLQQQTLVVPGQQLYIGPAGFRLRRLEQAGVQHIAITDGAIAGADTVMNEAAATPLPQSKQTAAGNYRWLVFFPFLVLAAVAWVGLSEKPVHNPPMPSSALVLAGSGSIDRPSDRPTQISQSVPIVAPVVAERLMQSSAVWHPGQQPKHTAAVTTPAIQTKLVTQTRPSKAILERAPTKPTKPTKPTTPKMPNASSVVTTAVAESLDLTNAQNSVRAVATTVTKPLDAARAAMQRGDLIAAVALLETVPANDPAEAASQQLRAQLLYIQGELESGLAR